MEFRQFFRPAVLTVLALLPATRSEAQVERFLPGHTRVVFSLSFSANGKLLGTASPGETILWSADSWRVEHVVKQPAAMVALSPDARRVYLMTGKTMLALGAPESGIETLALTLENSVLPLAIALSRNGKLLAGAGDNGAISVFDAVTQKQLWSGSETKTSILSLAFSPDSKTLLSGDKEGDIRLWNATTGKVLKLFKRDRDVRELAFSPDGKRFASCSPRESWLWDLGQGKVVSPLGVGCNDVAYSPNGKLIALTFNGGLYLLNAATLKTVGHAGSGDFYGLAFRPDGKFVAASEGEAGNIRVFELAALLDPKIDFTQVAGTPPYPDTSAKKTLPEVALIDAADRGIVEQARGALMLNTDVEVRTDDFTPLMLAASHKHADVVKLLLAAGANAKSQHLSGSGPLTDAAVSGEAESVKLLLAAGANANEARTDTGETPLLYAASKGYADVVKLLLPAKADANKSTKSGGAPLSFAAKENKAEIVTLLLNAGAVRDFKNPGGETAMRLAVKAGAKEAIAVLLKAGAPEEQPPGGVITPGEGLLGMELGRFTARDMLDKLGSSAFDELPELVTLASTGDKIVILTLYKGNPKHHLWHTPGGNTVGSTLADLKKEFNCEGFNPYKCDGGLIRVVVDDGVISSMEFRK